VFNPVLSLSSSKTLAFMGELALPLYMTNSMACFFVNRVLDSYGVPGSKERLGQGMHRVLLSELLTSDIKPWLILNFSLQFVVMHIVAWFLYTTCIAKAPAESDGKSLTFAPAEVIHGSK